MINVNDFLFGSDNEAFEKAIASKTSDGIIVVPPRKAGANPERSYWLLDRAILLPENTTVILQNCKIKLSDKCRDNFFRSANCGMGIEFPEKIQNIHIRGEGLCVLEGADHPRATGDSSKLLHAPCPHLPEDICRLADWVPAERKTPDKINFWDIHNHSYGTDAGKDGESQYGDWRGIGVLLANVENFSVSGLKIVKSHGWGISLEACSYGRVEKIEFDATMYKEIDGILMNMENQDGIDIRNGCHHIVISDITGRTGDDVIALTAIANPAYRPGGSVKNTHVMHNDWTKREKDIHDIVIRNVVAHSYLCYVMRLLPALASIYDVVIDGIVDDADNCQAACGTLLLGDMGSYGENKPDSMRNVTISNIICNSRNAISLKGFLTDSVISNVVNKNPNCSALTVTREDGMNNVSTFNIISAKTIK
ncbi:MAG: hypothetical protein II334_03100 [Clostridia bacterium]|nr:hypothetical protein [Clostridia bacterium]